MSAIPTFSVIVPCFNGAATLDEALRSARAQTADALEILVVDDGSTDASGAIAATHAAADPRVIVLRQPNGGVGAARNAGLARARGRYVQFLDADDVLEPTKLARQGAVLDAEAAVGLVVCDGTVIDGGSRAIWPTLVNLRRFAGHPSLLSVCLQGGPFPPVVPLLRTALVRAAGGFDEHRDVAGWADIDLWMRMAVDGLDYHVLADRLVRYRSTPTSMSADTVSMRRAAARVYATLAGTHPAEMAGALRAVQHRIAELEAARDDLRALAARAVTERDALIAAARPVPALSSLPAPDLRRSDVTALLYALARESAGRPRPIWIWGAGAAGRQLQARLSRAGGGAAAFVDSDPSRAGSTCEGVPVVSPADLPRATTRPYVLVASVHAAAIVPVLQALGWAATRDHLVADFEAALPPIADEVAA